MEKKNLKRGVRGLGYLVSGLEGGRIFIYRTSALSKALGQAMWVRGDAGMKSREVVYQGFIYFIFCFLSFFFFFFFFFYAQTPTSLGSGKMGGT